MHIKDNFLTGFYFGYVGSLIVLSYIQSCENKKMINKLRVNAEMQIDKHAELLKQIIEYKTDGTGNKKEALFS